MVPNVINQSKDFQTRTHCNVLVVLVGEKQIQLFKCTNSNYPWPVTLTERLRQEAELQLLSSTRLSMIQTEGKKIC